MREALANALIHADYYGRRGLVVEKYKDKLIISNPGTLRISLSEALEGGVSDPRNSLIFKMFVLVNVGERIGSGLQNIRYVWNSLELPVPFLREQFSPDRLHLDIPLLKYDSGMGSGVKEPEIIYKVPDNLSSNQRLILEFLLMDNHLSMAELSEKVGISKRKILDNINKLKERELLCRIGNNRNGYWEVRKDG